MDINYVKSVVFLTEITNNLRSFTFAGTKGKEKNQDGMFPVKIRMARLITQLSLNATTISMKEGF